MASNDGLFIVLNFIILEFCNYSRFEYLLSGFQIPRTVTVYKNYGFYLCPFHCDFVGFNGVVLCVEMKLCKPYRLSSAAIKIVVSLISKANYVRSAHD